MSRHVWHIDGTGAYLILCQSHGYEKAIFYLFHFQFQQCERKKNRTEVKVSLLFHLCWSISFAWLTYLRSSMRSRSKKWQRRNKIAEKQKHALQSSGYVISPERRVEQNTLTRTMPDTSFHAHPVCLTIDLMVTALALSEAFSFFATALIVSVAKTEKTESNQETKSNCNFCLFYFSFFVDDVVLYLLNVFSPNRRRVKWR